MEHNDEILIRKSKYLRMFDYDDKRYAYHSCLGNPVQIEPEFDKLLFLLEDDISLADFGKNSLLYRQVVFLLEKKLLEYENTEDLLVNGIEENKRRIETGELINLLVLDIHTACNMGCSYCYAAKTQEKHGIKGTAMTFEVAQRAIEQFSIMARKNNKKVASISYFGGEPLLNYKILKESLEYVTSLNACANDLKLTQAITTNGSLLSQERIELLKKHDCFVALSLDGKQQEHDKFRIFKNGEGTFQRIINNLKLLIQYEVEVEVIVTVSDHNSTKLGEFIDYIYDLGVRRLSLKGRTHETFTPDRRDSISKSVMDGVLYAKQKGMLAKKGPGELDYQRGCQGLGNLVCVEASGDIYPCAEGSRIKIGTVDNFAELPKSPGYNKISSRITGNVEQCRGCDVEGLCRAGCAGESEYLFDDIYTIDTSQCESIRSAIKRNLALFGKNW